MEELETKVTDEQPVEEVVDVVEQPIEEDTEATVTPEMQGAMNLKQMFNAKPESLKSMFPKSSSVEIIDPSRFSVGKTMVETVLENKELAMKIKDEVTVNGVSPSLEQTLREIVENGEVPEKEIMQVAIEDEGLEDEESLVSVYKRARGVRQFIQEDPSAAMLYASAESPSEKRAAFESIYDKNKDFLENPCDGIAGPCEDHIRNLQAITEEQLKKSLVKAKFSESISEMSGTELVTEFVSQLIPGLPDLAQRMTLTDNLEENGKLLGELKEYKRQELLNMSIEDRAKEMDKLLALRGELAGVKIPGLKLIEADLAMSLVDEYTTFDRVIDDVLSVFAIAAYSYPLFGAVANGAVSSVKAATSIRKMVSNIGLSQTKKDIEAYKELNQQYTDTLEYLSRTSLDKADKVNKAIREGEMTDEEVVNITGKTPEQIKIEDILTDGDKIEVTDDMRETFTLGADILSASQKEASISQALVDRFGEGVFNYTEKGAKKDFLKNLENSQLKIRGKLKVNDFKEETGEYSVTATYGNTDGKPFESSAEALETIKGNFSQLGIKDEDVKLFKKQSNGRYAEVDKNIQEQGEFVARVTQSGKASPESVSLDGYNKAVEFLGSSFDFFLTPINAFGKDFKKIANLTADRSSMLMDAFQFTTKKFESLTTDDKKVLNKLLDEGEARGDYFSDQELLKMLVTGEISTKTMDAYSSFKNSMNLSFKMDNEIQVKELNKKGYNLASFKDSNTGDEVRLAIKEVEMADLNKETKTFRAFDADKNEFVDIKREDLDNLIKDDAFTVGRQYEPMFDTSTKRMTDLTIFSKSTPTQYRKWSENDQAIGRLGGYKPRVNKGDYFIYEEVPNTTGNEPFIKAVGNFETKAQADAALRVIQSKQGDGFPSDSKYVVAESKELQREMQFGGLSTSTYSIIDELSTNTIGRRRSKNGLFSEVKVDANDSIVKIQAKTESPFETWQKFVQTKTSTYGSYDAVVALKKGFLKKYGEWFSTGFEEFPKTVDDLQLKRGVPDRIKSAMAAHLKEINKTESLAERSLVVNPLIVRSLTKLEEAVESENLVWIPKSVRKGAGSLVRATKTMLRDPTAKIKGIGYYTQIVGHPFKQALLGAAQTATVSAFTKKYANPIRAVADARNLHIGSEFLRENNVEAAREVAARFAKGSNITEQEAMSMLEAYRSSGLVGSMRLNDYFDASINLNIDPTKGKAMDTAASVLNTAKKAADFSRDIGFGFSEKANLAVSFVVFSEKYSKDMKKAIKDFTKKDWAEVARQTRSITFNQNKQNQLAFQRGDIGLLFMYTQVMVGAVQLAVLGNKTLTPFERAKYAGTSLALFGSRGTLGAEAIYEKTADRFFNSDPDYQNNDFYRELVQLGVLSVMLNASLSEATNESVQIDWTDYSTLNAGVFFMAETLMDKWDALSSGRVEALSPAFSPLVKIHGALSLGVSMFTGESFTEDFAKKDLEVLTNEFSSIFSGYNSINQAYIANANKDKFGGKITPFDSSGNPMVLNERTTTENVLAGIFGAKTLGESQYYEAQKAFRSRLENVAAEKKNVSKTIGKLYQSPQYGTVEERIKRIDIYTKSMYNAYVDAGLSSAEAISIINAGIKNAVNKDKQVEFINDVFKYNLRNGLEKEGKDLKAIQKMVENRDDESAEAIKGSLSWIFSNRGED